MTTLTPTLAPALAPAPTPTLRMVRSGKFTWHVKTVGTGPICLLIHGTGASVHSWDNLAELLAQHFTLVMMDLPGHAQTETPAHASLTLPAMAEALLQLIEQEELQAEMIIGHSAGAAIMLECALQHPECARRLVSINGAVVPLQGLAGYLFSPLARVGANSGWMANFFAYRAKNDRNIKKLLDSTGSTVDAASFRRYAELFSDPTHV
ncbi:alpha/beta fold hydrolase, partial [Granulosicoccus sp.]|nr:alpha/beta fold hydrolase [Granulosicoccus sp.]